MSTTSQHTNSPRGGVLPRIRARLFGERDAVDAQLADLARQGAGMARLAHACAFAMIVLFSAGSLVTLSGDAVAAIARDWHAGAVNIPQAISVGVSGLLVLCLDTGMLLAAATLRVLRARHAPWSERWVHVAILCGVAVVEASTYALMSVTYDQPHNAAAWAIILARSLSAPILSVYLALAQPLPVGPRDILAQVELASGAAVLRDVVRIAHDTGATLERKVRLYDASAAAPEGERARLARLIAVTAEPITLAAPSSGPESPPTRTQDGASTSTGEPPHRPPTGPGSPAQAPTRGTAGGAGANTRRQAPAVLRLETPPEWRKPAARARAKGSNPKRVRTASVETKVRASWHAGMSVSELQRAAQISRNAAAKWARVLEAEASSTSTSASAAQ